MGAARRELRAPALPRRGRARQGLAPRPDAGGRVAEARQPAPAVRLDVGPAREEAPLHGRRDRPVARVEPRARPRLAPARPRAAPRRAGLGPGPQPPLPQRGRAPRAGLRERRLRVGGLQRLGGERSHLPAQGAVAGGRGPRCLQPHPDAAARLPRRGPHRRTLAGALARRRRRPRRRAVVPPRATALAAADAPAARRRLPEAGGRGAPGIRLQNVATSRIPRVRRPTMGDTWSEATRAPFSRGRLFTRTTVRPTMYPSVAPATTSLT